MRLSSLLLLPFALALPARLESRQDDGVAAALSAVVAAIARPASAGSSGGSASSGNTPVTTSTTTYQAPDDVKYVQVAFDNCAETSSVSKVLIGPCEGGSGQAGDECVFTQGHNYTIVITYTSPLSVPQNQSRTGLASYDGEQRTAYSGQSFNACAYTSCPITSGVEANYTYPFRTFAAPNFQKLVFNATNGLQGESVMCASVPVKFKASA